MSFSALRGASRLPSSRSRSSSNSSPSAAAVAVVPTHHYQNALCCLQPLAHGIVQQPSIAHASSACPAAVPSTYSSSSSRNARISSSTVCSAAGTKAAGGAIDVDKEAHKIFDEAVITVRSGRGGDGEIVEAGRGKWVRNFKYHAGANQPKKIWLPASEPADGADGGDVVVVCDPSLDSLLHLHKRKEWAARRGGQGNPAAGSSGPKRNADIRKGSTPPLEIPVPPGTVVKRKGTGQVLGEVLQPGDRLVVATGGKGGQGVVAPSRVQKQKELAKEFKQAQKAGAEVYAVEDLNWKDDAKGLAGQQLSLQLMLRVVADVGLVGFPNAGKSSLLAALTRASPEVAPYPFTTLMPNLGVLAAGEAAARQQQGPVLADLPGLIEGAHLGKGLGRMFLRHLRRTRVLLQVVDASAADPGTDYLAVREELRMYNPEYVTRPHVVALNKMDLEDAGGLQQEIAQEVMSAAAQLQEQHAEDVPGLSAPAAVVPCSALTGEGLQELAAALQAVLQELSLGGSSGGDIIAQRVAQELERQQQDRLQQRRQQLMAMQQQQAGGDQQHQQQIVEVTRQVSADSAAVDAGSVAAAVAAALGAGAEAVTVVEAASSSGGVDAAAAGEDAAEEEGEWVEEWEEEGEDGEWTTLDLESFASAFAGAAAGSDSEDYEEEEEEEEGPPPPLPAGDPDAWLLNLSEEELLKLADEAE